ncbi:MAG: sugar phosphate nucleotidyltransferase [Thermoanaerobaculia bacterium]
MDGTHRKGSDSRPRVVGLIPAAGRGTRLGSLPFSKELYPIGSARFAPGQPIRERVVAECLLSQMREARISRALIILRAGKGDIKSYFGSGRDHGLALTYVELADSNSVVDSLAQALAAVSGAQIAIGFPDVLLRPYDALKRLISRHRRGSSEVTLGLFPTDHPAKADMVECDSQGRVRKLLIKPKESDLRFTWMLAVWSPLFSRFFLRFHLEDSRAEGTVRGAGRETYPSDVIQAAIDQGMKVGSLRFEDGRCLDIGTPEDLARSVDLQRWI